MAENAVAAWVAQVDRASVRNTHDVDILLRRCDLAAATAAMEAAGFIHAETPDVDMFLDSPGAGPRDAVHIIFANEKVRADDVLPNPDIEPVEFSESYRIATLESLVRMKLVSHGRKD